MVQNAGDFLKNGLKAKGVRLKISDNFMLFGLYFRYNWVTNYIRFVKDF